MSSKVKTKSTYKVENWSEYNQKLKKRGSLTIFIEKDSLEKWQYSGKKTKGGNRFYSDLAIQLCLQFRQFFKLPLRQTEGLVESIWKLMKVTVRTPDYTTLSRRTSTLKIKLPRYGQGKNTILIIDSTGLEMYEGGEWAERKRGYNRHKMWRKLHIIIDGNTKIIQECALTPNSIDDAEMAKHLLKNVKKIIKKAHCRQRVR